jgi:hypothetical protein
MTTENVTENVWRGTQASPAQVPYSVVSLISTSPMSNPTARTNGAAPLEEDVQVRIVLSELRARKAGLCPPVGRDRGARRGHLTQRQEST